MSKIAIVIPCFKAKASILRVIANIPDAISMIFVVDDHCPDGTGAWVEENITDPKVKVLYHDENQGVGGAVITGYKACLNNDIDIAVKIDADGQMDLSHLLALVEPIVKERADYTKGNRFYDFSFLASMPRTRVLGNAMLSFICKVSSGYWNIMDPTNGYTAIHCAILPYLKLEKVAKRYFFESDMLFRLSTIRAVVKDIPMPAIYGDEISHLNIGKALFEFSFKHLRNSFKRVFYAYFWHDFNGGTIQLLASMLMIVFSLIYGGQAWYQSIESGIPSPTGVVVIAALPLIFGVQLLINVINWDMFNIPKEPIHKSLSYQGTQFGEK